jgi:hypothetical protein
VPDWLTFTEDGRRYRVSGLEALQSDVAKAAFEVERLVGERTTACRQALDWCRGRHASEFARRANDLLSAMVDLHLVLLELRQLLARFPEDRLRLASVVERVGDSGGVTRPRLRPASGPAGRVETDSGTLRRYAAMAGHLDQPIAGLVRVTDLDGVTAQRSAAVAPAGVDVPVQWEPMNSAELLPLPDLVPLVSLIRDRSRETAEFALHAAQSFERADAELIAQLNRRSDLAAFTAGHLGPAGAAAVSRGGTRRHDLSRAAGMRAYATVWEHLRAFDTAAKGGRPDGYISRADLRAASRNRKLPPEAREAAALLLRRGTRRLRRADIVRHLVDGRAFAADPEAARRFVESLPVAHNGRPGLPVGLCSTEGVRALANAALAAAGDSLTAQQRIIARLPETNDGTRNELITAFYDILGDKVDAVLAGPAAGNPHVRGHPGANWLMYAPWASDGVHNVITGDMQVSGVGPRQEMRQGAADGNQWIFDDITARFAAFVELYQSDPSPSAEQLERFFADHFGPGDAEIRKGFAAYVTAMAEDDPARRQALTFQGNVSVATHEQAGAQPYLEEVGAAIPDRLEVRYIDLVIGHHEIAVDGSVNLKPHRSNLIVPGKILDLDPARLAIGDYSTPGGLSFTTNPDLAGPGVVHLEPISGIKGFPTSMAEWHARGGIIERPGIGGGTFPLPTDPDGTAGSGALSWADPHERMWTITKVFEQTHTDRTLWDTEPLEQFDDLGWLSERARPR